MDKMFAKWGGGEVLKKAVRGMLPKNRLRDDRMARLKGKSFERGWAVTVVVLTYLQYLRAWRIHISRIFSRSAIKHG